MRQIRMVRQSASVLRPGPHHAREADAACDQRRQHRHDADSEEREREEPVESRLSRDGPADRGDGQHKTKGALHKKHIESLTGVEFLSRHRHMMPLEPRVWGTPP